MNIVWYGNSCFKIQSKDLVLITDPFDKSVGLKPPFCRADIVTVSHQHCDHNNVATLKDDPFVISGPGEYEIKEVAIRGISSFHDNQEGAERGTNAIFVIEMEGIRICHLGDLGQDNLINGQLEKIGAVDILMIPVGGVFTIDWKKADSVINQIEPRIIIPMHYKIPGLNLKIDTLDKFAHERGVSKKEAVSKLSVKKKDLPQEEAETIIMKLGN